MEYVLEAIFDLIFKVDTPIKNKWFYYPFVFLLGVFYIGIFIFLVLSGFLVLGDGLWQALFPWIIALAYIIYIILTIRDKYRAYKKKIGKLK